MASLKQVTYVREINIDIHASDRIDDFHQMVRNDPTVPFIKSMEGNPVLHGVYTEGYYRYAPPHDLVVLAIGMESSVSDLPIKVRVNESGFIELDENNAAIFAAACSRHALDMNRTAQRALNFCAALKA